MDYISKADCEKRGFVRGADGLWRKFNTLEKYAASGGLDKGKPCYSAVDRLSAGLRLARDYYSARLENLSANDVSKVKVDGRGCFNRPDNVIDAENRYRRAVAAVPLEFWPVVRLVCIEDRPIEENKNISRRQAQYEVYHAKRLLCFGLDRLIDFYLKQKF